MKAFIKKSGKRILNYIADYLAREINKTLVMVEQSPSPESSDMILSDFNHYLHELRSNELSRMPKGVKVLLSAGCSGKWYFEWIEKEYGMVHKHIGIEYYMPEPDDLPEYVEWISNTVGDMKEVSTESVDCVFSGQNIEHLLFDDLLGFMLESHRVLKKGGWLILDSPNRLVTSQIKWLQPEHIAEYTADEMEEMLLADGFTTINKKGILLMQSSSDVPPWSINMSEYAWKNDNGWLRRAINARNRPNDSFIWWLEAKKTDNVDKEKLRLVCERIFNFARQERIEREGLT